MSTTQRGLGRGLDALFKGGGRTESAGGDTHTLPLSALVPNPQQPRRHFADQQLEELAASIKTQGVLQPILVRPVPGSTPQQYEIVAGERRWRASSLAGLQEVPVTVRELNDQETLVIALVENLQREDLNPLEEAQGMQQLRDEFGLSQEDLAKRLGKSRSGVANALRLLTLSEAARADLAEGRLTAGHARTLLSITDPEAQDQLRLRITQQHLAVREAEALAAIWKESGELPAGDYAAKRPAGKKTPTAKAYNAFVGRLQEELSLQFALPATVSGTEHKGRISLAYNSADDLQNLLAKLGVNGGIDV